MDYRILGPLEIRAGDRLVPLRGGRQRELMAVLLLRANEIVSSDRLIDELWEGEPPPTAAKMIQNGVSQLRKLIEPDVLVTRSPGYLVVVQPDELDAHRFQRTVEEARADLGAVARPGACGLRGHPVCAGRGGQARGAAVGGNRGSDRG